MYGDKEDLYLPKRKENQHVVRLAKPSMEEKEDFFNLPDWLAEEMTVSKQEGEKIDFKFTTIVNKARL